MYNKSYCNLLILYTLNYCIRISVSTAIAPIRDRLDDVRHVAKRINANLAQVCVKRVAIEDELLDHILAPEHLFDAHMGVGVLR